MKEIINKYKFTQNLTFSDNIWEDDKFWLVVFKDEWFELKAKRELSMYKGKYQNIELFDTIYNSLNYGNKSKRQRRINGSSN